MIACGTGSVMSWTQSGWTVRRLISALGRLYRRVHRNTIRERTCKTVYVITCLNENGLSEYVVVRVHSYVCLHSTPQVYTRNALSTHIYQLYKSLVKDD